MTAQESFWWGICAAPIIVPLTAIVLYQWYKLAIKLATEWDRLCLRRYIKLLQDATNSVRHFGDLHRPELVETLVVHDGVETWQQELVPGFSEACRCPNCTSINERLRAHQQRSPHYYRRHQAFLKP